MEEIEYIDDKLGVLQGLVDMVNEQLQKCNEPEGVQVALRFIEDDDHGYGLVERSTRKGLRISMYRDFKVTPDDNS